MHISNHTRLFFAHSMNFTQDAEREMKFTQGVNSMPCVKVLGHLTPTIPHIMLAIFELLSSDKILLNTYFTYF